MSEIKPTTVQDRMDVLAEVVETVRDAATEWTGTAYMSHADEGILHGASVKLVWQTDGSVLVKLDGEIVGRVEVEISARFLEHLDAVNEPIGGVLYRTWATVPAGWFVQTPKGAWLEVIGSIFTGTKQLVSMTVDGKVGHWERDPAGPVKARKGSLSNTGRDDALDVIESAFTTAILQDGEGPMQS